MAKEYPDVKVIDLAVNSGQHNALMAALRHADGDVIIGMDDDGQTHPSQLGKLFETFDQDTIWYTGIIRRRNTAGSGIWGAASTT